MTCTLHMEMQNTLTLSQRRPTMHILLLNTLQGNTSDLVMGTDSISTKMLLAVHQSSCNANLPSYLISCSFWICRFLPFSDLKPTTPHPLSRSRHAPLEVVSTARSEAFVLGRSTDGSSNDVWIPMYQCASVPTNVPTSPLQTHATGPSSTVSDGSTFTPTGR